MTNEMIKNRIIELRGKKVLLDSDLAELYEVETKVLNQAVSRNKERFPEDFMFELTQREWNNLRSQFVTSNAGGRRYRPKAFTEQGVAMLSGVLKSQKAVGVNIAIMRAFVQIRQLASVHAEIVERLTTLEGKNEDVERILRYLLEEKEAPQEREQIGY